jgi:hypothetical protein
MSAWVWPLTGWKVLASMMTECHVIMSELGMLSSNSNGPGGTFNEYTQPGGPTSPTSS